MAKIFNRSLLIGGEKRKIGTPSVTILEYDSNSKVRRAIGSTVPSDGDSGYEKGCIFIKSGGGVAATLYINEGTSSSADFNIIKSTPLKTKVALSDANATLTASQMIDSGLFTITPTVARTLTTDTASNLVSAMTGYQAGTWFDFSIICLAAFDVTLAGGTGVTIVGSAVANDSSATFRVRYDSASAVTIYRI